MHRFGCPEGKPLHLISSLDISTFKGMPEFALGAYALHTKLLLQFFLWTILSVRYETQSKNTILHPKFSTYLCCSWFHYYFFFSQDNLLEKLDDVELEAPSSQDEEVRITFDCSLNDAQNPSCYLRGRMNNLYLLFGA